MSMSVRTGPMPQISVRAGALYLLRNGRLHWNHQCLGGYASRTVRFKRVAKVGSVLLSVEKPIDNQGTSDGLHANSPECKKCSGPSSFMMRIPANVDSPEVWLFECQHCKEVSFH